MGYVSTPLKREIEISSIITIHYLEYSKNFVFHGEAHNFWEFLYVDKGNILVQADERSYNMSAEEIIFHKPNEFHAIKALGSKSPNLVAISFECSSPSIQFFENKIFTLSIEERKIISLILSEAKNAFSNPLNIPTIEQVELTFSPLFGSQQLIAIHLEFLLITLCRKHQYCNILDAAESQEQESFTLNLPPESERLKSILAFMELHICDQLSVCKICDEFLISRSTLHTLFYKEKGCGVMEYYNMKKIEYAKEIMRDRKMNLTEVAHFLSYSSLQYFSKQFKHVTGMSPLEYISSVKGISQAVEHATPAHTIKKQSI